MDRIESSKLIALRQERAKHLISLLKDEIDDLKRRLSLVEVHNEELQVLFDKLSADQSAIDSAIEASLESVEQDVVDDTFDDEMNAEIADAESFVIDASDEEGDFDFDDDDDDEE